jgi:hypothetical protein
MINAITVHSKVMTKLHFCQQPKQKQYGLGILRLAIMSFDVFRKQSVHFLVCVDLWLQ